MTVHVVVNTVNCDYFIRLLLADELREHRNDIRIVMGGSRSSAESLARSIIIARNEPVALVEDSRLIHEEQADERLGFLQWYFGQVTTPSMWCVVLFNPSILSVLFQEASLIQRILNLQDPLDQQLLIRAEYDPSRVFDELLATQNLTYAEFWTRALVTPFNWGQLAEKSEKLRTLKAFLRRHFERVAA